MTATNEATATAATTLAQQIEQTVEAAVMQPLNEKIEVWFARSFNDSPVSRDTAIYNYVRAAVNTLKQDLAS